MNRYHFETTLEFFRKEYKFSGTFLLSNDQYMWVQTKLTSSLDVDLALPLWMESDILEYLQNYYSDELEACVRRSA